MSKLKQVKEELKELCSKYDDLDFAHLALQNEYKDQQELKNRSHFNNARLRKRIQDLEYENQKLYDRIEKITASALVASKSIETFRETIENLD